MSRSPEANLDRMAEAAASIAASYARMAHCSEANLEIAKEHLVTSKAAVEATMALEAKLGEIKNGN